MLYVPARSENLPRKTDSRSATRSNVFLAALLVTDSSSFPVRIRNLSPRGALLDGSSLPTAGLTVRLVRGGLTAQGRIAWQAGNQIGISFDDQIEVDQWVQRVGHAGQQRVDFVVAALRRDEGPAEVAEPMELPSLASISSELDQICVRLASTPGLTVQLAEDLLRLDGLAHALRLLSTPGAS
jgi:hypothetical protein